MKTLSTFFNYIHDLSLTKKDAELCSHSGDCSLDVNFVSKKQYVKKQLDAIDKDSLVKELRDYGAWDSDELQDHSQNLQRILWIAAGNITDEIYMSR